MDQPYGNSVHMSAFPMHSQHHQHSGQQHYSPHSQYQQLFNEISDSCYQSPNFHDAAYHGDQYGYHSTSSVPYGTGIESYLDPKYASNPAAFASRLPYLPFHAAAVAAYGMYDYSFEPAFIRKRNERERQRVKCVNEGYARLREHLPEEYAEKRLSKVETLRGAIMYIKQLQTVLGFDPEKITKVKKSGDKNDAQAEKAIDKPRREDSHRCGSVGSESFDGIVEKIELSTEDLMKSECDENSDCKPSDNKARHSPCVLKLHNSPRSNTKSPTFYTHEYSPHAASPSPPTGCRVGKRKDCAIRERTQLVENDLMSNVTKLSSPGNIEDEQCDWWGRSCNRSNMNTIFDCMEDCSENLNKQFLQNHTGSDIWANRPSRHHPYKAINAKNSTMSDSWDDVFQIKVETHTPPPYDESFEFSCQQQYSSCQRIFTKARQAAFRTEHVTKDGQSDGFKTDTSPESLTGLSP